MSWHARPAGCGHQRCERLGMAASFLLLLAVVCIASGTAGHTFSIPWLIAGIVFLAGWASACTCPHPHPDAKVTQAQLEAFIDAEQAAQEDLEALARVVGLDCGACVNDYGPCRCPEDCGERGVGS